LHEAPTSFVNLLNENAVDIDQTLLREFESDMDEGYGKEVTTRRLLVRREEMERWRRYEGMSDSSQPAQCKRRMNYSDVEDACLMKAWESVSLDAVSSKDQTRRRYWQRIEDKFFQFMPRLASTKPHTYRSLQDRWNVIKAACIHWSGCLEQVRNAPPSVAMAELIDEETKMMDPTTMDAYTRVEGFGKDGDLATKETSARWWWWSSGGGSGGDAQLVVVVAEVLLWLVVVAEVMPPVCLASPMMHPSTCCGSFGEV
jgi:hypothetical protein